MGAGGAGHGIRWREEGRRGSAWLTAACRGVNGIIKPGSVVTLGSCVNRILAADTIERRIIYSRERGREQSKRGRELLSVLEALAI